MITDDSIGTQKHRHQIFVNIVCQIQVKKKETKQSEKVIIENRCSVLSSPITTDSVRSTSFSSSISTEFTPSNPPMTNPSPYNVRRPPGSFLLFLFSIVSIISKFRLAAAHTPPPSRLNHLHVNGSKGKCEHPSKKSSVDPTIFTT